MLNLQYREGAEPLPYRVRCKLRAKLEFEAQKSALNGRKGKKK